MKADKGQINLFSMFDVVPLLDEFDREHELKKIKASSSLINDAESLGCKIISEERLMRSDAVFLEHGDLEPKYFEARPYTIKIAKQALLENSLVILPTGLGKTYAGILLIIKTIQKNPDGKILFLAPTKPLCEQHQKTLENGLPKLTTRFLTGRISPKKRPLLWEESQIIIATPETIAEEVKKESTVGRAKDISLILIDEVHHASGNYAYVPLVKKYLEKNPSIHIVGFTASPDSDFQKLLDLQKIFKVPNEQILARNYNSPDVKPYCFVRFIRPVFLEKEPTELQREFKASLIKLITQKYKRLERVSGIELSEHVYLNNDNKVVGVRISSFNNLMSKIQAMLAGSENIHERGLALVDWAMCMKLANAIDRLDKGMPEFIFYLQKQFDAMHKKPSSANRDFTNSLEIRGIVSKILEPLIRKRFNQGLISGLTKLTKLSKQDVLQASYQNGVINIDNIAFNKLGVNLDKSYKQNQADKKIKEQFIWWSFCYRLNEALTKLDKNIYHFSDYLQEMYYNHQENPKDSIELIVNNPEITKIIACLRHYNFWKLNIYPAKINSSPVFDTEIDWEQTWEEPKLKKIAELVDKTEDKQILIFVKYRDSLRKVINYLQYKFPTITCARLTGTSSNFGDPGMKQSEQAQVLQKYKDGKIQILVSTSIGEEGLDFPAVDTIIFYEPISDVRRYIQRLGRTARHKHGSVYILVFHDSGEETIYYSSRAEEKSIRKLIQYYQDKQNHPS